MVFFFITNLPVKKAVTKRAYLLQKQLGDLRGPLIVAILSLGISIKFEPNHCFNYIRILQDW